MDKTLKNVLDLLLHADEDVKCAAAKIVGELRLDDPEVIKALGDATSDTKLAVRCAALEALGYTGRTDALRYILPHLTSPQLGERNRAVSATVALGPQVLPAALKELAGDEPVLRSTLLTILQRFPLEDSFEFLLQILPKADREATNQICEDFHRKTSGLPDAERMAFAGTLRKFVSRSTVRRSEDTLVAGLRMLGGLRDDSSASLYMKILDSDSDNARVTRQALLALAKIDIPEADHAKLWKTVMKTLQNEDNPSLVEAAAEIGTQLGPPKTAGKDLIPLLQHQERTAVSLAVRKLGEIGSEEAGEALAGCADVPDWRLREEVMVNLRKCPNAGAVLLERLETLDDDETAQQASEAILEIRPELTEAQFQKFFKEALELQAAGQARAQSLLALLSSLDKEAFTREIGEQGKRLLKEGEYAGAESCLRLLGGPGSQNSEAKFLLALARFKVSDKGLLRAERELNRSLPLFAEMVEMGDLDMAEALIKEEGLLDRSELYYLGFHFVEQMGKPKQFGAELLRHLISSSPRSKEAKDAKNKLKTSGLE